MGIDLTLPQRLVRIGSLGFIFAPISLCFGLDD